MMNPKFLNRLLVEALEEAEQSYKAILNQETYQKQVDAEERFNQVVTRIKGILHFEKWNPVLEWFVSNLLVDFAKGHFSKEQTVYVLTVPVNNLDWLTSCSYADSLYEKMRLAMEMVKQNQLRNPTTGHVEWKPNADIAAVLADKFLATCHL